MRGLQSKLTARTASNAQRREHSVAAAHDDERRGPLRYALGLKRNEIQDLEECVRKTIARTVTPIWPASPSSRIENFARWLVKTSRQNPVEIFTVNYDVLIEHAMEAERIPIFDGFVGATSLLLP